MVELIQDRQRLFPGCPGLRRIPSSVAGVAEVIENLGQAEAAANRAVRWMSAQSCQSPRTSRNRDSAHATCHTWVWKPAS